MERAMGIENTALEWLSPEINTLLDLPGAACDYCVKNGAAPATVAARIARSAVQANAQKSL